MTTTEAADILGIKPQHIQNWCNRMRHRKVKAGTRMIYDISEDELYLVRYAMRRAIESAASKREKTNA